MVGCDKGLKCFSVNFAEGSITEVKLEINKTENLMNVLDVSFDEKFAYLASENGLIFSLDETR